MNKAEQIYREVFGQVDNRSFKTGKLAEIEEWLANGDSSAPVAELAAEWREYDAADVERYS